MSAALKFNRWIDPAGRRAPGVVHAIDATQTEREQLARWLDIPAVGRLHADLVLMRSGAEFVTVTGSFQADVDLVCGISLETFGETISGEITREFRKPHTISTREELGESAEVVVDLNTEEPGEWRPQGIDLGAMLAEELSLALPDFPRKPGSELEEIEEKEAEEPPPNPFAALTRLKDTEG